MAKKKKKVEPSAKDLTELEKSQGLVIDSSGRKRRKVECYSRVVGYMRPIGQWNSGKKEEFKDRKEYRPEKNKG